MTGSLFTLSDAEGMVRGPRANDDKYSRGVVGFLTGSREYPGAARLGVEAALHTGVGMVRVLTQEGANTLIAERPEVVAHSGAVNALVVGSGWPPRGADEVSHLIATRVPEGAYPTVVDAGALAHAASFSGPKVLTPHHREMRRLCVHPHQHEEIEACAVGMAGHFDAVIVLKGHHTVVVTPDGIAFRLPPATPWLATAGTGDVLAGILGALLASPHPTPMTLEDLALRAAVAALIHLESARRLSLESGAGVPGPFTALHLARSVGPVVARLVDRTAVED